MKSLNTYIITEAGRGGQYVNTYGTYGAKHEGGVNNDGATPVARCVDVLRRALGRGPWKPPGEFTLSREQSRPCTHGRRVFNDGPI